MKGFDLQDLCAGLGAVLIVLGLWWIYQPLGPIFLGLVFFRLAKIKVK